MTRSKRLPKNDPHAKREAARYDNPIASREFILQIITDHGVPTTFERLCERLKLEVSGQSEALRARLGAMVRDGQLLVNRKHGYVVVEKANLHPGTVSAHPHGFGFLLPDAGGDDFYLSGKQMRMVLHGDRVVVRQIGETRRGKREGLIVEIIERANTTLVGRYVRESGVGLLIADNKRIHLDIIISPDQQGQAKPGQIVVVEITDQPGKHSPPVGRVIRVLGDHMMPGMEIETAIVSHGIPAFFPTEVDEEIDGLTDKVSSADKRDRLDLRDMALVTIDGEDAKDFDDAVFCERRPAGWRLVVAIADVSHYVLPDTALDKEARTRGTSVYFPGRVVPMLPEILSNGLCSLNPAVDRLCMVCDLSINHEGEITRSRFREAVMRSRARLTYKQVSAMLQGQRDSPEVELLRPQLEALHELYKVLKGSRGKRGAIDFDTVETSIVFSDDRKIERIEPVIRNDAHKLIEECMILANVAAARFLQRHAMPALFRVHGAPKADRIEELRTFLGQRGLRLTGGVVPESIDFANLSRRVQKRPDCHVIQISILRTLSQAIYTPQCDGHFGLALENYAHFTSPIRRYPDLLVHRAIRHIIRRGKKSNYIYGEDDMRRLGQECSSAERRADEATRDVTSWLKCEYMLDHVGDTFNGVVSAVTPFGMFVELDDIYIEGLVHITSLPKDYYRHDPVAQTLIGERSGRNYSLGDRLQVSVLQVALDERKIDLGLAGSAARDKKKSSKGGRAGG
jgi:ribonuclease R